IDAVNTFLPELKEAIRSDPTVGEIARIAIIAFGEGARSELALCDLAYADLPTLRAEGAYTDFTAAFDVTKREIEDEIRGLGRGTKFHRPVVFFISDGQFNPPASAPSDWNGAHDALVDKNWKFRPEIVAFGFGEANQSEIQRIATRHAFFANDDDPVAAVREIMKTIIGTIKVTTRSLREDQGGLIVRPSDPNRFTVL